MSRRHLGVTPGQSFATPLCHRAPKDSDAYEVDVSELFHGLGWHDVGEAHARRGGEEAEVTRQILNPSNVETT